MYLPSFYKIKFEQYFFNVKRVSCLGIPVMLWTTWVMYPHIYNTIYTDFIKPERGVQKRVKEQ